MEFEHGCIVMTDGYIDSSGKVYGKFNLIDTPVGQIVKKFQDAGVIFGISIRGAGDIVNNSVEPDTFVFRGFDLVSFPAYPESIPKFTSIAASTNLEDRKKYKAVCAAVCKNLENINSCSTIDILQSQFAPEGLSQGIEESMPKVTETMTACINSIVSSAESFNLEDMRQNAELMSGNVILSFTQMGGSTGKVLSSMKKAVVSIITGTTSIVILNLKNMSLQAVTVLSFMSVNVAATMNQMKSNIDNIDLYSSGVNIMNGLINGMESKQSMLIVTAKSIADTVKNTMRQALDIHSPSKVLYKIGEYTGMGQINGMKSTLPEIQQTANKMGQKSVPVNSYDKKYSPSGNTVSYSRNSASENVNYAPVFNLTISGTSDDRVMARKIKKMIAEAMNEMVSSYESKSRTVREV